MRPGFGNVFSQLWMEMSPPGEVPWHSYEEFMKDREPWASWPVWGQPERDHGCFVVPCSDLPFLLESVDEATYTCIAKLELCDGIIFIQSVSRRGPPTDLAGKSKGTDDGMTPAHYSKGSVILGRTWVCLYTYSSYVFPRRILSIMMQCHWR